MDDQPKPGQTPRRGVKRRAAGRFRSPLLFVAITGAFMGIASCTTVVVPGQSISLSPEESAALRLEMQRDTVELERPVVILSGYHAWPSMADRLADRIAKMTSGDRSDVLDIAYTSKGDFADIVPFAIEKIEERFPSDDPDETVEVDVIGISAGGLVARAAALPLDEGLPRAKRLKIRRLFTMGTPHRGAILAEKIAPDQAAKDMIAGSDFLEQLDAALPDVDYEIYPYAHLNDTWVGATRSSPVGMPAYWTGGLRMFSHFGVSDNKLFQLDIARRLRGEEPVALPPTVPPRD